MTKVKEKFVAHIKAGDRVDDIFVLAEKRLGHKRDGDAFLNVTLTDRSGRIKGVVWDNALQIAAATDAGQFVRAGGAVGQYRGALQLVVQQLIAVPAKSVAPEDFLPSTSRDVPRMFERLKALTDTIACDNLRALINAFWNDAEVVRKFKRAPAAKMIHHAYVGGLLEHTLSMALLVDKIADHYTDVDRDLLLVGVVLHDIGKLRELCYHHSLDYTDEGRLLSHIALGLEMVQAKIDGLDSFPQDRAALIKHMIVSHHGTREFGSPEPPKTIEAVLLNYIDEIDSRMNAIRAFMAAQDPNASWTAYHRLFERHFYKGSAAPSGA